MSAVPLVVFFRLVKSLQISKFVEWSELASIGVTGCIKGSCSYLAKKMVG